MVHREIRIDISSLIIIYVCAFNFKFIHIIRLSDNKKRTILFPNQSTQRSVTQVTCLLEEPCRRKPFFAKECRYRVFFLLLRPKKWHIVSDYIVNPIKKSSKCQNLLTDKNLWFLGGHQLKKHSVWKGLKKVVIFWCKNGGRESLVVHMAFKKTFFSSQM